jgi:hypothetical protein
MNEEDPLILYTDTSTKAIGGVLMQVRNGIEKPVIFISHALSDQTTRWGIMELELYAFVYCVKNLTYLLGKQFTVRRDHRNLLYLSKNKSINESQLMDSIKSIPDIIATTFTLYVNNSSFKNMQSSGLLSYVDEEELKTSLSYYYEVVFKRIESNNNFFDQVGTELNGILPIGIGTLIRKVRTDSTNYDLNKPSNYLNFMLSLNETKNLLQSEKFIYDLQRYYNQIFVYQLALKLAKAENQKLIQLLKSEHK